MKRARKKKDNNNIPADKNIVCSEKRIQFCNFSSVFQTLLNSNFIDAVYTSEILFFPPNFRQNPGAGYTQMSVIHPGLRYMKLQFTNILYEITKHAELRCYTVEYNIQTVYMKLLIMLSQGATL